MLDGGRWFAVAMGMEVKAKTSMMVKLAMAKRTDPECVLRMFDLYFYLWLWLWWCVVGGGTLLPRVP